MAIRRKVLYRGNIYERGKERKEEEGSGNRGFI